MQTIGAKTEVLIEALPYITRYEGKTFVVKYGGAAMVDEELRETFAQDVTLLKKIGIRVAIVHGGGREITDLASRLGLESRFVDGQRYTDEVMMDVVQMVLAGKTNKDIVARINQHDGNAVGVCGIDANLLRVRKLAPQGNDLGYVGEISDINTGFLDLLLSNNSMPVIAPVGVNGDGHAYNVNADLAAAAIASALKAEKLVYLSDVEGVLVGGTLVPSMDQREGERLIGEKVISHGMIPKIRSAFDALHAGVNKVHLVDGRIKHSLLLEIFTDTGIGTELVHAVPPPGRG
jgi:acetylglutamate kinase